MEPCLNFNRVGSVAHDWCKRYPPRDLVRFLYLAKGNDYIWAHDGKKHIYNNGAFTISDGLFPESLLYIDVKDTRSASRARCGVLAIEADMEGKAMCESRKR